MTRSRVATPDAWAALRARTPARIALGRAGGSLPTAEVLAFSAAHAAARDAVWSALDEDALASALAPAGLPVLRLASRAPDRLTYLQRPDLGRRLSEDSEARAARAGAAGPFDVALVVGDGLSALAAQRHAPAVVTGLCEALRARGLTLAPLATVRQARVAVEDPVGAALQARLAIVLLGERPGLASADGLGAYLVHGPRPGRTDAERNCVSNIRPEGLPPAAAVELLTWLAAEALRRGLSGVGLKDERALAPAPARPGLTS
ncbi:MAG: ethanolamine ammonia-lyase subunit EutC [Anaeromyxobacter sp.]